MKTNQKTLTKSQENLILSLFDNGMIKFGEFRFKLHDKDPNAPLAPFYIDLRMIRRFPLVRRKVVEVYVDLLKNLKFDLLADVPTSATPIVGIISDRLGVPQITPRSDAKTHGTGAKIDGLLKEDKGKKAVLIDDLITRADSKFEAAKVLKDFGVKVKDVVVLVDRQQGGKKQLAKKGFKLHFAFTLSQMMDLFKNKKRLSQQEYNDAMQKLEAMNKYLGVKN